MPSPFTGLLYHIFYSVSIEILQGKKGKSRKVLSKFAVSHGGTKAPPYGCRKDLLNVWGGGGGGRDDAKKILSLRDIGLAAARSLVGSKGPPDLYSLPTRTLRYPYEGNPINDPSRFVFR